MMKVLRSETARNAVKMLSGNAIGQAIGLFAYPVLTRLYAPDDFGLLNLFLSIGGILLLFATADYQYAILLPKSEKKAASTLQAASIIASGIVILTGLSVFFREPIASIFKAPGLAVFYPLLPLFVLLSAAWTLLNYWFTREKRFGAVSFYQVSQNLGNAVFKIGAGYCGYLRWGLFTSTLLGLAVSLGISIASTFRSWKNKLLEFDRQQIAKAFRRYVRFPLYSLPRSLVNNLSSNLPFFMLTPAFGLETMGYFGMGLTLAFRPVNMVAASLYQVFFQRMAQNVQERKPVRTFFKKFVLRTLILVVPAFSLLYFILPQLCRRLLGPGWETTGEYIRLMLPWIAMVCMGSCISFIADIFQKQAGMLLIEIAYLVLRTAGLLAGIFYRDIRLAILLYSLSGAAVIAFQLFWYDRILIRYERSLQN